LGIGILHDSQENALFHSGNNMDFKALMIIEQETMNRVVLLTNGQQGAALVNEIATYALEKLSRQE
jgi:hypothetical protein